jgi:outer membrane protein OmpA-like peptidoglycan-associated protein
MKISQKYLSRAVAAAVLAGALALMSFHHTAQAEDLSAQQILDGLKVAKTRSLSTPERPAMTADDLAFVKRVRGQTRSLSLDQRERMAEIAPKRPKVNLDINFEYNSASLSPKAEPQLHDLGKALSNAELAGSTVMVGGHTDAKGGDDYNQRLSERRAETVKRFLVRNYRIPAENLISAGYGKKGLKNAADPLASENRRVEIVNMAERDEAAR